VSLRTIARADSTAGSGNQLSGSGMEKNLLSGATLLRGSDGLTTDVAEAAFTACTDAMINSGMEIAKN
jgi:hypothetical protein